MKSGLCLETSELQSLHPASQQGTRSPSAQGCKNQPDCPICLLLPPDLKANRENNKSSKGFQQPEKGRSSQHKHISCQQNRVTARDRKVLEQITKTLKKTKVKSKSQMLSGDKITGFPN